MVPQGALAAPQEALAAPREVLVVPREAMVVPREAMVVPREAMAVPREAPVVPREAPVVPREAPVALLGIVAQQGVRQGIAVVQEALPGMAVGAGAEPMPAFATQTERRALEGLAGRRGSCEQALLWSRWVFPQTALGQKQEEISCRRRT